MKGLNDLKKEKGKFLTIGKDGDNLRLGWVNIFSWKIIKKQLDDLSLLTSKHHNFIFIGMGGSINIIKALISYYGAKNIFTIDSLDPAAFNELKEIENPLVVAISKSGTTMETKLIADKFCSNKVIWLKDKEGDFRIQFDNACDIGGRFSAPNTLIFWLPLFLIFNKNFDKVEKIHQLFLSQIDKIQAEMWQLGEIISKKKIQYFQINCHPSLSNWMTQLFQESLGSKIENFYPKSIVGGKKIDAFYQIKLSDDLITSLYQAQILVASIAYYKEINFVNQPSVEKYKKLINDKLSHNKVNKNLKLDNFKFVEIVCYWYLKEEEKNKIKNEYQIKYPDKIILIFEGSDWNHHSYQAASDNPETLYLILTKNVDETLNKIALATHLSLENKSILIDTLEREKKK